MKVIWKTKERGAKIKGKLIFKNGLNIIKSQHTEIYYWTALVKAKERVEVDIFVNGEKVEPNRRGRVDAILARLDIPVDSLEVPVRSNKWVHLSKVLEHTTRPIHGFVFAYHQYDDERVMLYVKQYRDGIYIVRDVEYSYPLKKITYYVEVPAGTEVKFVRR